MKTDKKSFLVLCLSVLISFFFSTAINAQKTMVGGSFIYNLNTKSFGIGARSKIPLKKVDFLEGISIVPQLSYFPAFNPITEFYIGSAVQVDLYTTGRWTFYSLLNLSYNGWINHDDTNYREGNFSNAGIEPGIGVSRKLFKCFHPFFEFRYNIWWSEFNMGLGLLYTLKCDRRSAVPCSKIPAQPQF